MKIKICPVCKEYLNSNDVEEWCSICDYSIYIKQYPKNLLANEVSRGLRSKLGGDEN